jgi:ribosome assembly protein RRB1
MGIWASIPEPFHFAPISNLLKLLFSCHSSKKKKTKGTFSVWDLRNFKVPDPSVPPRPLARFRSHRSPITSLEWHPTDESMIAVSDDRGTYIYDLSIEEDDPDAASAAKNSDEGGGDSCVLGGEIPPQLLFVHSGSEMTKEVRWHPQIPSCVTTTSLNGFSVFIPSNL